MNGMSQLALKSMQIQKDGAFFIKAETVKRILGLPPQEANHSCHSFRTKKTCTALS